MRSKFEARTHYYKKSFFMYLKEFSKFLYSETKLLILSELNRHRKHSAII